MAKQRRELSLQEYLQKLQKAGLKTGLLKERRRFEDIADIGQRISMIEEHLRQNVNNKSTGMLFFVMYDIEDHKIRLHIAKYLKKQGCTRVQKSIFLGNADMKKYKDISKTLAEVNAMYQNGDSILVLPVTKENMTQLHVIGKQVDYKMVVSPPNVVII